MTEVRPCADRREFFDRWAADYDLTVESGAGAFPFDGYQEVLERVVALAAPTRGMSVLDIGVGTGALASLFLDHGCEVWGVDLSASMIALARARASGLSLVRADILAGWPVELPARFDRIVSAYTFHEFDLATKVKLLDELARRHLSEGGGILIGDIAFRDRRARDAASRVWRDAWDDGESYWVADEASEAARGQGLTLHFERVPPWGGVFALCPGSAVRDVDDAGAVGGRGGRI